MSRENSRTEKQSVASPEEEIHHLKRLLVTIKQKYEQTLQQINQQLQSEISAKNSLQNELNNSQREISELKKQHEDEHESLIHQQLILKDLLTAAQKESEEKLKAWQENLLSQNELTDPSQSIAPALLRKIEILEERVHQQSSLQEKYELVKEELALLSVKFEEALEGRLQAEEYLKEAKTTAQSMNVLILEKDKELKAIQEIHQHCQINMQEHHRLAEEHESHLKIAQQHLAKKVKESALLSEQINTLQLHLSEQEHAHANAQFHINQMQTQIDGLQKQEKKLQEDLHESLKTNEIQIAKWEEKYFRMYDKWQESENKIKELSKLEERHYRMQALLNNLGSLMEVTTPICEPRHQHIEEDYDSFGITHQSAEKHE